MPKNDISQKNPSLTILLSHIVFIFSAPKKNKSLQVYYDNISCHGPLPFLLEHLLCLSHHKIRWTMSLDNVKSVRP